MVYNGKPYKNGWFGGKTHYFRKHPYWDISEGEKPSPSLFFPHEIKSLHMSFGWSLWTSSNSILLIFLPQEVPWQTDPKGHFKPLQILMFSKVGGLVFPSTFFHFFVAHCFKIGIWCFPNFVRVKLPNKKYLNEEIHLSRFKSKKTSTQRGSAPKNISAAIHCWSPEKDWFQRRFLWSVVIFFSSCKDVLLLLGIGITRRLSYLHFTLSNIYTGNITRKLYHLLRNLIFYPVQESHLRKPLSLFTYVYVYIYIYDPGLRFPNPPPTPPQCDDPVHTTHCSNDYMAAALLLWRWVGRNRI